MTECEGLDKRDNWTCLLKANLLKVKGSLDQAIYYYGAIVTQEAGAPSSVPCILLRVLTQPKKVAAYAIRGLAICKLEQEKYPESLSLFQRVLKIRPDLKPDVRVSIGICYSKLGMHDYARKAFKRAFERVSGAVGI